MTWHPFAYSDNITCLYCTFTHLLYSWIQALNLIGQFEVHLSRIGPPKGALDLNFINNLTLACFERQTCEKCGTRIFGYFNIQIRITGCQFAKICQELNTQKHEICFCYIIAKKIVNDFSFLISMIFLFFSEFANR